MNLNTRRLERAYEEKLRKQTTKSVEQNLLAEIDRLTCEVNTWHTSVPHFDQVSDEMYAWHSSAPLEPPLDLVQLGIVARRLEEEFGGVLYGSFQVPVGKNREAESTPKAWDCGKEIAEANFTLEHGDEQSVPDGWACLLDRSHSVGSTEAGSVHEASDCESV
jgi:hypothetical protein